MAFYMRKNNMKTRFIVSILIGILTCLMGFPIFHNNTLDIKNIFILIVCLLITDVIITKNER